MSMNDLTELRHHLHRHPETSQHEVETQQYLLKLLDSLNTDKVQKVANTGILVSFRGKAPGKNLLFRADIDALPIQETIDTSYKSVNPGVSHKCGHDGHTTIMYGVAKYFAHHKPLRGNVHL